MFYVMRIVKTGVVNFGTIRVQRTGISSGHINVRGGSTGNL